MGESRNMWIEKIKLITAFRYMNEEDIGNTDEDESWMIKQMNKGRDE